MTSIDEAEQAFTAAWPAALAAWSPYTRLSPPILCRTKAQASAEGLEGSFAMIRLRDDRIVIGLEDVARRGLAAHARAILAHEVGHYLHAPGTLLDHVRLQDRIRRTLPTELRAHAGLVGNLYTDTLLNDRLVRHRAADIAAVFVALREEEVTGLWSLYTRTYERLWGLPSGSLGPVASEHVDCDAQIAARITRLFRDDFLEGGPAYALLLEPYLRVLPADKQVLPAWMDTAGSSVGDAVPDGLALDDWSPEQVKHPARDARITDEEGDGGSPGDGGVGRHGKGDGRADRRSVPKGPQDWLELMRSVGVKGSDKELVARYYRELAMPHVIPFPVERLERAGDPLPEGTEPWEPGSPLERIDWNATLMNSPVVIAGVTTVERSYGLTDGGEPELRPPDLYIGIDCSGSMGNPAHQLAYPVLAGVVLALSALRAGARVMVCLSGEWHGSGQFLETDGFIRDEAKILNVLVDYLGTGASFGLPRLVKTFVEAPARARPAHILVVSDSDLFGEIGGTKGGFELVGRASQKAAGGATAVLRLASEQGYAEPLASLRAAGFEPCIVSSQEELVDFARAFSRRTFVRRDGVGSSR